MLDLDLACAQAMARLEMSIAGNTSWQLKLYREKWGKIRAAKEQKMAQDAQLRAQMFEMQQAAYSDFRFMRNIGVSVYGGGGGYGPLTGYSPYSWRSNLFT